MARLIDPSKLVIASAEHVNTEIGTHAAADCRAGCSFFKPKETREERGRRQLQEVYRHLDGVGGDRRIAWYGQLRAEEYSHEEALRKTVEEFKLEREPWYQVRFPD